MGGTLIRMKGNTVMNTEDALTVTIRRKIKPGLEERFEQRLREFIPQSLRFAGHLGVQVIRPAEIALSEMPSEWVVVIRFRSRETYDAFRTSPEYVQWCAEIRDLLVDDPVTQERYGLENWFRLPGAVETPVLPAWKMALVTWIGVNVCVIGLTLLLGSIVGSWPLVPRALVMNALVVALLTWLVMPLLTRLFRSWLYPHSIRGQHL